MTFHHAKPSVQVYAFRIRKLTVRDRLRVLFGQTLTIAARATAPRWMPPAKWECRLLVGTEPAADGFSLELRTGADVLEDPAVRIALKLALRQAEKAPASA